MKNLLIKLFSPFKRLSPGEKTWSGVALIIILLLLWTFSGSAYLPPPLDIAKAFPDLIMNKNIFWHFQKSLFFCFKTMGYSIIISLFFCYISVLPLFSSLCDFLRKFRFLPSAGLAFFFLKVAGGTIEGEMEWMMIFGITTWLLDSMIGIALGITDEEIMYARSLRLSRWETMKEVLILGKAADLFSAAISIFAMAWMLLAAVENIAKASGGIGVILSEQNKYFHLEQVYAIQILILLTGITIDFLLRRLKEFLFPYTALKN